MHLSAILPAFVASLSLVSALPPTDGRVANDGSLRLIKTSEADPGVWVTEEQKITQYVAKNIGFIDITDIKVNIAYLAHHTRLSNLDIRMRQFSTASQPCKANPPSKLVLSPIPLH